jgi:ABC-type transport system substrate-binding protein
VDFDRHLNIVPGLATSYEWADSKTVIFHLRPNVLFQDGEKMDAAAVKYTLDRMWTASNRRRALWRCPGVAGVGWRNVAAARAVVVANSTQAGWIAPG